MLSNNADFTKMKTIAFATSNDHKMEELRHILPQYKILGLKDLGIQEEIHETGSTLEENALIKAEFLFNKTGQSSFSEDTGLEVDALNGAPGVHTARYAGVSRNPEANMDLLIDNLKENSDRSAQFRTVIVYKSANEVRIFEGIVRGQIAKTKSGQGGFGYDPVFIPDGYNNTFAELDQTIKNQISHRAKAVKYLLEYLILRSD